MRRFSLPPDVDALFLEQSPAPDHTDDEISKRRWERAMMAWKNKRMTTWRRVLIEQARCELLLPENLEEELNITDPAPSTTTGSDAAFQGFFREWLARRTEWWQMYGVSSVTV